LYLIAGVYAAGMALAKKRLFMYEDRACPKTRLVRTFGSMKQVLEPFFRS
jgi:hypothetical protein